MVNVSPNYISFNWLNNVVKILLFFVCQGVLYDDKKGRIDTIHARPEDVAIGEQLESDRHYILIEEESTVGSANQNEAPQSPAVVEPIKSETLKPQIRTGLKRRRGVCGNDINSGSDLLDF